MIEASQRDNEFRAVPPGLSKEEREAVILLREKLVKAGWIPGAIHWDSEIRRTIGFSARCPTGKSVYVACEEAALVRKLEGLLDHSD